MEYYFAPMEGLTDSIYRRLHHSYFPGIHKYYTPFFSPTAHRQLSGRECRELPPADELGYTAVPQILTKNAQDFLWMAGQCADRGYQEVNLNLGCPSGTVTAKGKGAGMLTDIATLDSFLYEIYQSAAIGISVKTRIGFTDPEEFPAILEVFNRYPIKELIIHPRVRNAFYKGNVDTNAFRYGLCNSKAPVCFNGNICSTEDIERTAADYPEIDSVMIGRALIADPGMLSPSGTTKETLEAFYNALLEEYLVAFGGSRNAMFRLKENWYYLICKFEGGEKLAKRLRKTTDLKEYKAITKEIFTTLPLRSVVAPNW